LVDAALHPHTLHIRVSFQAWRAPAGGLVVGGVALCIACTGVVSHAGIQTVPVGADLCDLALLV